MTVTWFNPILVQLGPVAVHWYGVMYAVAFLLGYFYFRYSSHGKSMPLSNDQKDLFLAYVICGILLGGRIGYILFYNFAYYLSAPLKIFAVWEGGMSFHGGVIGVGVAMWLFARRHRAFAPSSRARFLVLSDLVCAIAPLGLFFGRIGNFINGELYGRVAAASGQQWLERVCMYFPADPLNCRYPSQLFQAGLEGMTLFVILWVVRRFAYSTKSAGGHGKSDGVVTCAFLFFYGVFRIIAELFRQPDAQIGFLPFGVTEGQVLSAAMILAGVVLFVCLRRGKWKRFSG